MNRWMRTTPAWLLPLAAAAALAQSTPAPRQGGYYAAAPAVMQTFFAQAAAADKIADRLQRCLAFPDMPGNQWSAGLAAAYCELVNGPHLTLAQVDALLQQGALPELERLFKRDLDSHFAPTGVSEVIHRDFDTFNESDEADRVSRMWLEKAPGSAYALTARASYLAALGWKRRGHASYSLTSEQALADLESLTAQAIALLHKALAIEPRLIHAHVEIVDIGRHGPFEEAGELAFDQGKALDPGCRHLSKMWMMGLQPRWGGSHKAMGAYALQLEPLAAARPLVKLSTWMVAEDMAHVLNESERWDDAIRVGRTSTRQVPNITAHYRLATSLKRHPTGGEANRWEALAAMMTAYRFDDEDAESLDSLGHGLYKAGDIGWARKVFLKSHKRKPDGGYASYFVGVTYADEGRHAEAIPYLSRAMADPEHRVDAMRKLLLSLIEDEQLARADEVARMYVARDPDNAFVWWWNARLQTRLGQPVKAEAALANYLRVVDRKDAGSADLIALAQASYDALVAANKKRAKP